MQAAALQRALPGCHSAVTCRDGGTLQQEFKTHRRLALNGKSFLTGYRSLACEAKSVASGKRGQRRLQPAVMQSQSGRTISTVQLTEERNNEARPVVDWRQIARHQQAVDPLPSTSNYREESGDPNERQSYERQSAESHTNGSQSDELHSAQSQSNQSHSNESQSGQSRTDAASTSGRTQASEKETMALYKDWVQGASRDSVWKDGTVRLGDQLVRIRRGQVSIVASPSPKILALAAAAAPATQHSVKARAQKRQAATARMQARTREYERTAARAAQRDARGRNGLKAYLHLLLACYDRLTLPQEQRFSRRVLAHQALQTVRAELELRLERPPTDAEWALAADIGSVEELHQRVERGISAKCRLVEGNLRLAVSIANKFRGMGLDFEDLVQAGIMGLIKGVDRYDVRKGFRFSTYTTYWIRQSIQATLRRDSRLVRLPAYAWSYLSRISRARTELRSRLGRPANLEETAAAVQLPAKTVRRLLAASREVLSLEGGGATSILGDGEKFESWADKLIDPNCDKDPYETLAREGAPNDIERILSRLEAEEARVLELRLGLRGQAVHTLVQTSQLTSIPFGRIAPIQKKAIAKLQGPYKKDVEDLLTV